MGMDSPAVSCNGCRRSWNSVAMAEGLRALGACPRCNGRLTFADAAPPVPAAPETTVAVAPHLVLGLPRR